MPVGPVGDIGPGGNGTSGTLDRSGLLGGGPHNFQWFYMYLESGETVDLTWAITPIGNTGGDWFYFADFVPGVLTSGPATQTATGSTSNAADLPDRWVRVSIGEVAPYDVAWTFTIVRHPLPPPIAHSPFVLTPPVRTPEDCCPQYLRTGVDKASSSGAMGGGQPRGECYASGYSYLSDWYESNRPYPPLLTLPSPYGIARMCRDHAGSFYWLDYAAYDNGDAKASGAQLRLGSSDLAATQTHSVGLIEETQTTPVVYQWTPVDTDVSVLEDCMYATVYRLEPAAGNTRVPMVLRVGFGATYSVYWTGAAGDYASQIGVASDGAVWWTATVSGVRTLYRNGVALTLGFTLSSEAFFVTPWGTVIVKNQTTGRRMDVSPDGSSVLAWPDGCPLIENGVWVTSMHNEDYSRLYIFTQYGGGAMIDWNNCGAEQIYLGVIVVH